MKKIILLLALALGVEVKGQIVGGFIPLNSSKTPTMGGLRVNGAITATGTIKTGSTTIQGNGNATVTLPALSGTLANLSDALFSLHFTHAVGNVADATNYYFGNSGFPLTTTSAGTINLPYNCTLVGWDFSAVVNSTVGSAENSTLSINGSTNYTLSTTITYSAASGFQDFSATGLSQQFNANDKINIKILTPTWATNPAQLFGGITLWFVRRS